MRGAECGKEDMGAGSAELESSSDDQDREVETAGSPESPWGVRRNMEAYWALAIVRCPGVGANPSARRQPMPDTEIAVVESDMCSP